MKFFWLCLEKIGTSRRQKLNSRTLVIFNVPLINYRKKVMLLTFFVQFRNILTELKKNWLWFFMYGTLENSRRKGLPFKMVQFIQEHHPTFLGSHNCLDCFPKVTKVVVLTVLTRQTTLLFELV